MFDGSIVPKVLLFRRFYVPKVLLFRRFYIPKYEVLYSEGPIFRRFYIPKVLCSEISGFVANHQNSSSETVVDDMDDVERVRVGVEAKIKKSGNVEITARTRRLK